MLMEKPIFGCVADDFTGASDAASFLQKAGMRTILINEVQQDLEIPKGIEAIVIALKTRTVPVDEAVNSTMDAIIWMEKQGVQKFYFKPELFTPIGK